MPELSRARRRQLAALKHDYEAGLGAAVENIVAAAASLGANGCHRSGLRALRHLAHRLTGSSAIWGFSTLSAVAARLEDLAMRASEAPRVPAGEFATQSKRLTRLLWQAVPTRLRSRPAFTTGGARARPPARPSARRGAARRPALAQPSRAGSQRKPRLTMRCTSSS